MSSPSCRPLRAGIDPRARRYARQTSVRGFGARGQEALSRARVWVIGNGLDAQICALYLAGSGVGEVIVDAALVDRCRALNTDIDVSATEREIGSMTMPFEVRLLAPGEAVFVPEASEDDLLRGARGARWVIAKLMSQVAP